ncbi:hypothetical protein ACMAZF_06695 [Psychrobium sp. nBUS_13]|uniref:hypothetical protein n=1 Tax=Psychrobium sp. nBUS_13 TaxID=3395319 RepID=UPI003EBC7B59
MTKTLISTILLYSITIVGCSSNITAIDYESCYFPNTSVKAPVWVCDEPIEGLTLQATGVAEQSGAGVDFMKTIATASAKDRLAQSFESEVQSLVKIFLGTTGRTEQETVDATQEVIQRQFTKQRLQGIKIQKSLQGPDKRMYVLVGLSEESFKTNAKKLINSSFNSDSAEWQRIQADKGFKQLGEAIDNYESN